MEREKETIDYKILMRLLSGALSEREYSGLCVRLFERMYKEDKQGAN